MCRRNKLVLEHSGAAPAVCHYPHAGPVPGQCQCQSCVGFQDRTPMRRPHSPRHPFPHLEMLGAWCGAAAVLGCSLLPREHCNRTATALLGSGTSRRNWATKPFERYAPLHLKRPKGGLGAIHSPKIAPTFKRKPVIFTLHVLRRLPAGVFGRVCRRSGQSASCCSASLTVRLRTAC